ncbi:sugar ABC transporter permease [Humibacter sp. RRB41]|uniref:sugar ABC transporter permease n=1 Tax=Humibacter sp. RRB41 TaxID=2919946 RepID=UPI001FAAD878|nr:sugar ABC transporter permease [Humibacter sp. RRB41]
MSAPDDTGTIGDAVAGFTSKLRGGDLGSLPVVVGLVIIAVLFQALNPRFLAPGNLVNLTLQAAPLGVIALGTVVVLLAAQIDLSVGSVSGLASAIVGVCAMRLQWPMLVGIVAAIAAGALIGAFYGFLLSRFGVPSFLITLAGLLGFLGLQLALLGPTGSINIPFSNPLVQFANTWFLPPWAAYLIVGIAAIGMLVEGLARRRRRARADLPLSHISITIVKAASLLVLLSIAVWYLSLDRGTAVMPVLFVLLVVIMSYLLRRTRWGRSIYAVGGNVEAARRAGIRVTRTLVTAFVICSAFAALGGVLSAARLGSATTLTGTADTNLNAIAAAIIGGTSLFGGRGNAWSAVLGVLVISAISSGLTLLNLDASVRYMITGAVLLLAVIADSLSRRSRTSHGRA